MLAHEDTIKLIESAQKGDDDSKATLITSNLPLIKSIVKRYKNAQIDYEDLMQLGCMGLVKAINNFDSSYGVKFSTYAVPMIAGEIKRFIRDDGAVKVSRALKTLSTKLHAYMDEYLQLNGQSPTIEHLSEYFGVDRQEIIFAMDSNKYPVSLYEKYDDESGQCVMDKLPSEDDSDELIDKILLKKLLEELPEREKTVIILRYYRDKTQSEIASVLGVSQVQVSRIETKVLNMMRRHLA
ncbi:MAG: SigB/SigF/SigG family RNA polymerase sigma factor [Clostridia bacterium]|nr:SigB/SigF/SigG family RNA polymerase sigma factor [Clostridia bacterium]